MADAKQLIEAFNPGGRSLPGVGAEYAEIVREINYCRGYGSHIPGDFGFSEREALSVRSIDENGVHFQWRDSDPHDGGSWDSHFTMPLEYALNPAALDALRSTIPAEQAAMDEREEAERRQCIAENEARERAVYLALKQKYETTLG